MATTTGNPKTTLYVGGLEENVTETTLHSAFVPFGDIKDINIPLDQSTQKHRGFGFVTFLEKEDAAAAMDNMHNAELYGRILTVNIAAPMKIKGGEQGWASQPVWADADTWFERQQREEELKQLKKEHDATVAAAEEEEARKRRERQGGEEEEDVVVVASAGGASAAAADPMAAAEAEAMAAAS